MIIQWRKIVRVVGLGLSIITSIATLGQGLRAQAFTHPGVGLNIADLNAIKAHLTDEPWATAYAMLQKDGHSSLSYTMQGPFSYVNRNNGGNYDHEGAWKNDMQAVYNLARMWYFTGNAAYAQKSHDILIAWANTQTAFGGIEAPFDLGDYAPAYAGGADILRGTWSGWTATDTTIVQSYFANVFWPCTGVPQLAASGSQGMESLQAALGIAVFNDDTTKFNQVLSLFLTDADTGFGDSLANGQIGDMGRDQGHSGLYLFNMAWMGEVFWKQGVDVFSIRDNRLLAVGEYYARYNLPGSTPAFAPFSAPFWGLFTGISGAPRSSGWSRGAMNILHGAYAVRKGMSVPWVDLWGHDQIEDADSFMFCKTADLSTAAAATVPAQPATASVSVLTSADLNGCTPAGSTTYSGGTWTLSSGYNGGDPWSSSQANDTVRFAYKQVTGDFTMIAKVISVQNIGNTSSKAGIMLRDSLGAATIRAWVALNPMGTNYERAVKGWNDLPYGTNAASMRFGNSQLPYWIKLQRIGNRLQGFMSLNGGDWSPVIVAGYANIPTTMYVGLFGCSAVTGSLFTATFTDVRVTGGNGGEAPKVPPAPLAVYASPGDGRVPLRWNEAFNASNYNVKRSTTSGSGYTTIATVNNTTYTDTGVSNGTTYYYVVTAVNSAGESSNSLQDSVTPQSAMVNVTFGGTATASAWGTSVETPIKAFDYNPGTKWFCPATTGWLQYDLGAGNTQTVKRYAITSGGDVPARDPRNWQFQASNDGSTWTTLDTKSSQNSFPYRQQTFNYDISSPSAYRYYRLNITANNGDVDLQIAELALYSFPAIGNGKYGLQNHNGNWLDTAGASGNGATVAQWQSSSSNNQKWMLAYQHDGYYKITNVATGLCLDSMGSTINGSPVKQWQNSGSLNQDWMIIPMGNGYCKIVSRSVGLVLDSAGLTANGSVIQQWPSSSTVNQQWQIIP